MILLNIGFPSSCCFFTRIKLVKIINNFKLLKNIRYLIKSWIIRNTVIFCKTLRGRTGLLKEYGVKEHRLQHLYLSADKFLTPPPSQRYVNPWVNGECINLERKKKKVCKVWFHRILHIWFICQNFDRIGSFILYAYTTGCPNKHGNSVTNLILSFQTIL